jgi:hypothetical protein
MREGGGMLLNLMFIIIGVAPILGELMVQRPSFPSPPHLSNMLQTVFRGELQQIGDSYASGWHITTSSLGSCGSEGGPSCACK